jgi:hypothetical protein
MKRLLELVVIVVLLCVVVSCNHQKWQEVRTGLNTSLDQLPKLPGFETVTTLRGESSMKGCYYAETRVVLGTSLPEKEALDVYVDELESLGWIANERQYERERVLKRGTQERIRVTTYLGLSVETDENYIKAKDAYPTIISVSLTFYVPQRDGC